MKSQADCYRALLDGKTLVNEKTGEFAYIGDENFLITSSGIGNDFWLCGNWKIKEEPKKLYAYRLAGGSTIIFRTEIRDDLADKRRPEYDLEYPNGDK